jgi:hypothetical protein
MKTNVLKNKLVLLLALAGITVGPLSSMMYPASNSHSKLIRFEFAQGVPADSSTVDGSSAKLTRGDSAVWIRVNTTELPPGTYTNWWVVFNNPSACAGGCGADDFGNPEVAASVFFATGGIVGQDGVGHFQAHLEEGAGVPQLPGQTFFGPGLLDAQGAEIHYILRYHGPASSDPDLLQKQISTSYGGCTPLLPAFPPDPVPAHQIYPCYDPQATALPLP